MDISKKASEKSSFYSNIRSGVKNVAKAAVLSLLLSTPACENSSRSKGDTTKSSFEVAQLKSINSDSSYQSRTCTPLDDSAHNYLEDGLYDEALELYQKQRDSFAPNDTFGQWKASTNLASVYYYMKDYETSLKYYGKSLQLAKQMKDNQSVLLNYNDIIQIYMAQGALQTAFDTAKKANVFLPKVDSKDKHKGEATVQLLYGTFLELYTKLDNFDEAQLYSDRLFSEITDKEPEDYTWILTLQGKLLAAQKRYQEALPVLFNSLHVASNVGPVYQQDALKAIVDVYSHLGNYKEAWKYDKKRYALEQARINQEAMASLEVENVENEKRLLQKEKETTELKNKEQELQISRQRWITIGIGTISALLLVIGFAVSSSISQKRKHSESLRKKEEEKNKELSEKNELITQQKNTLQETYYKLGEVNVDLLSKKEELEQINEILKLGNDHLMALHEERESALKVAERLLFSTVLPKESDIKKAFPESFIYFKPRDIVGGDFYFLRDYCDKVYFAVGDCTGHAYQGALLSVHISRLMSNIMKKLDSDILRNNPDVMKKNPEILDKALHTTSDILNDLTKEINIHLWNGSDNNSSSYKSITANPEENRDSLEIGLCCLNKNTNQLEYAGAYNSLYIFRGAEMFEIPGDKHQMGDLFKQGDGFKLHKIDVKNGDFVYMFSDGVVDQFGGPDGKKLKISRLRDKLKQMNEQGKNAQEQKKELTQFLEDWQKQHVTQNHVKELPVDDALLWAIQITGLQADDLKRVSVGDTKQIEKN